MINEIIQIFQPLITELPWVERYGGLAKLLTIKGTGNAADTIYPVAENVTNTNCHDVNNLLQEKRYKFLMPDHNVKSILYYEHETPITMDTARNNSRTFHYTTSIRLIAWLNIQKIGATGASIKGQCAAHLISLFQDKKWGNIGQFIGVKTGNISADNETATINSVFNKYTYGKEQYLYYYPYELFSLNIPLHFMMSRNCQPPLMTTEPIECITYDV